VPSSKETLRERLARYGQIKIGVIGRKSGHKISILVWFVFESDRLFLLPVQGSDTQWYKTVLKNPSIRIDARGVGAEFRAVPVTDAKAVKSVVEKFREKYGAKDVRKYYSKFDGAVLAIVGRSVFVVRTCETSLARGPSYAFGFSSPMSCWFQRPRL
jgi:hypothetical protein